MSAIVLACGSGDPTAPGGTTPVASLTLAFPADTLLVGQDVQAEVVVRDAGGAELRDRPVTWASSDSTRLSISAGGRVTAKRSGAVTLTASSGAASATHTLVVRALHFTRVFTGDRTSCGLEASGELWCWGFVPASGYGNGSSERIASPLPRPAAVGLRFTDVALDRVFACGIEANGAVSCWGDNPSGQLGDGTRTAHYSPANVSGLPPVSAITTGSGHACALAADGRVFCWGGNSVGQLGDATRIDRTTPVPVPGLAGVSALDATDGRTCAIAGAGALCWGEDYTGGLGHDTTYNRPSPVLAAAAMTIAPSWSGITAGAFHICALTGGSAYCWGGFDVGLYDALYDFARPIPESQAPGHQFVRMADGYSVNCGLQSDGSVWCWLFGMAPLRFPSTRTLVDVTVDYSGVCALDSDGAASCWDARGALFGAAATAIPVTGAPPLAHIAGGTISSSSCGITPAGAIWCWSGWYNARAAALAAPEGTYTSIWSGGGYNPCALTATGDVGCYQFGAFAPSASGYGFVAVGAGEAHICALDAAGAALCWGKNAYGQLGDGTLAAHTAPAPVAGGHVFVSIASGTSHSCGTTAAGAIWCWGRGYDSQLGDGTQPNSAVPVPVTGGSGFTAVRLSGTSCALGSGGTVSCWPGHNTVVTPAPIVQLAGGYQGFCGLDAAGSAVCWRGDGSSSYPLLSPAAGALHFKSIAGDGSAVCGITLAGATWCWGYNSSGQLGSPDGAVAWSSQIPLLVYGQE